MIPLLIHFTPGILTYFRLWWVVVIYKFFYDFLLPSLTWCVTSPPPPLISGIVSLTCLSYPPTATLNVKLKFLEIEKQVLEEMTQGKRDPNNAVDGEMCHLLFAENENLKAHCTFLKDKADAKEAEARQQRRRVRELEVEREKMEEQMKGFKETERKVVEVLNSEERAYKRASEYTPKSALRQMVDELNRECGKSV